MMMRAATKAVLRSKDKKKYVVKGFLADLHQRWETCSRLVFLFRIWCDKPQAVESCSREACAFQSPVLRCCICNCACPCTVLHDHALDLEDSDTRKRLPRLVFIQALSQAIVCVSVEGCRSHTFFGLALVPVLQGRRFRPSAS